MSQNIAYWASISPFDTNNISFSWKLVTTPSSGQIVLSFDYSKFSIEQAGLNGALGDLRLTSTCNLTVEFVGNTIIITQHLVFNISVRQLRTSGEGNIFDKKIVDTYTIGISNGGKLVELSNSPQSVLTDNSNSPSVINALNFFPNSTPSATISLTALVDLLALGWEEMIYHPFRLFKTLFFLGEVVCF